MTTYSELHCICGHTLKDHSMATQLPCSCGCPRWERPLPATGARRLQGEELAALKRRERTERARARFDR